MDSLPSVQNSAQSTPPIKTPNSHRKPTKNSRAFLAAKKKNKFKYSIPSFASTLPSDDSSILSEQSSSNVSSQDVEKNSVRTSSCSSTVPVSQAAGIDVMIQQAKMSKAAGIGSVIQQAKMSKAAGIDSVIQQAKMSKAAGIESVIQQAKMSKASGIDTMIKQAKMSKAAGIGSVIQQAKMSKAAGIDSVVQQAKLSKAAGIDSVTQQAKMSKAAGVDISIQQAKKNAVSQLQQDGCTGHFISFDSQFVDAGNNNQILTLIKANFPPYGQDFEGGEPTGRFCNGRLPTDFLSEMLRIKPSIPAYLDPAFGIEDFATGVTFASSGTGYDVATSTILAVIPLSEELDYFKEYLAKLTSFLGNDSTAETARESLYIISIGTNDFVLNYFTVPGRSLQFTVDEYEDFLLGIARNFLTELYSLGARKIVIVGLPPNDRLPIVKTLNLVPVRPNYNVKLQNLVSSLSIELEGIKLVYADIYNPLLHIIQNPNIYGFENVEEGCCATGTVEFGIPCIAGNALSCPDPGKYVFFDADIQVKSDPDFCPLLHKEKEKHNGKKIRSREQINFQNLSCSETPQLMQVITIKFQPWQKVTFYHTDKISKVENRLDGFATVDFATGVTFASAGTGYDVATSKVSAVIPLSKELEYFKEYLKKLSSFLGKDGAVKTTRESLYFISVGTNDFILNYFTVPGRSSQFTIAEYEDFLIGIARNFLIELYSLGAKNISRLPPSGCLPFVKTLNLVPGRPSLEEIKKASKDFNVKLQNLVATLSIELDGIELVYADIYNPLLNVIQNPNLYGN
ncbi:hypothetical protein MKW98_029366 [Papaver atlanticum]|uniref:Uncharacterized protein n=1 Tax=Papaver atlanticum TaxID=357466 RepID=A0AAD4XE84_9MAGN|nr:hypothetical protein MKW98_029366 [Papaver atlanticum]